MLLDLIESVRQWTPWLPLFLVALETAGMPVPLPSEVLLVVAGSFVAGERLSFPVAVGLGLVAGLAGDHVGYLAGRRLGPHLAARYGRHSPGVGRAIGFATAVVRRLGPLVVPAASFVPGIRNLVMGLVGGAGVGYRAFFVADVLGSLAWAATYITLGEALGDTWYRHAAGELSYRGVLLLVVLGLTGMALSLYWIAGRGRASRGGSTPTARRRRRRERGGMKGPGHELGRSAP